MKRPDVVRELELFADAVFSGLKSDLGIEDTVPQRFLPIRFSESP